MTANMHILFPLSFIIDQSVDAITFSKELKFFLSAAIMTARKVFVSIIFTIALSQDFGMDDMMGGMGGMPGMGGMGGGGPPAPPGIIELDRFSFHKVVDGSHNVLVLFDDGYSGGGQEVFLNL